MKKVIIIAIIIFLIVVAMLFDNLFVKTKSLKYNNVVVESYSPDDKYKAVKFTRNINATTKVSYHLSILRKNDRLKDKPGNTYVSYEDFDLEWIDDTTVRISHQNKNVFKCNSSRFDIKIEYRIK